MWPWQATDGPDAVPRLRQLIHGYDFPKRLKIRDGEGLPMVGPTAILGTGEWPCDAGRHAYPPRPGASSAPDGPLHSWQPSTDDLGLVWGHEQPRLYGRVRTSLACWTTGVVSHVSPVSSGGRLAERLKWQESKFALTLGDCQRVASAKVPTRLQRSETMLRSASAAAAAEPAAIATCAATPQPSEAPPFPPAPDDPHELGRAGKYCAIRQFEGYYGSLDGAYTFRSSEVVRPRGGGPADPNAKLTLDGA